MKTSKRPEVLFFDVNESLLDLEPLKKSVAKAFGGRDDLVTLWFTTMLQYSLVESAGESYQEFGEIGAAAMVMVARKNEIDLGIEEAKEAIKPITSLPAHPDVKPALERLKDAGYRLVTLTNSPQKGVDAQMENAGLSHFFEKRLSVGEIETYKPNRRTYLWAAEQMGVKPENSMLLAAHGWDIAGARWAGLRAVFLSRPGAQLYPLGPPPEHSSADLSKAADYLVTLE
ncbi:haloacid dehalogenase type II [Luteolibacter algae]|uniref:Haloacid dehalogenase type II n=1 Tax=Luteolibacter algae TaxID=454151 RepID=A0ABW5D7H8_9BACT